MAIGKTRAEPGPAPINDPRLRRLNEGILQFLERPALRYLSAAIPAWVTPDMLTALGFAGSVVAALGYVFAADDPRFLWLASVGIVINWFGDSLDGNVARARGIERPTYGFFLDNTTDILEYAVFAIGFGVSGYVSWAMAFGTLAAFYMMMLVGLVKLRAMDIFQISFGGLGLTEIRVVFILLNVVMYFVPPRPFMVFGESTTYPNVTAALWIVVQLGTFLVVTVGTLRELSRTDPPKTTALKGGQDQPAIWHP